MSQPSSPEERSEEPRLHDLERRGEAQGHDFGSGLDAEERRALLEYLKTLYTARNLTLIVLG